MIHPREKQQLVEAKPAKRGVHLLLPPVLPPNAMRLVLDFFCDAHTRDYTEGGLSHLCQMVRLSLQGALHDAYVIDESTDDVTVLAKCGASLRIPRSDLGGMAWPVGPDTNPHSMASLTPQWFTLAMESRRTKGVGVEIGSIEGHFVDDPSKHYTHRRVRLFASGETKAKPWRPPFFVYCKTFLPYMTFFVANPAERYMREAAAYSAALTLCQPAVSPMCYYVNFNEDTGSYCAVLEDLVQYPHVSLPQLPKSEFDLLDTYDQLAAEYVFRLKPLFFTLAILHGRFLVRDKDYRGLESRERNFKELKHSMVHQKIFYAAWQQALIDDEQLQQLLEHAYGIEPPAAIADAQAAEEQQQASAEEGEEEEEKKEEKGETVDGEEENEAAANEQSLEEQEEEEDGAAAETTETQNGQLQQQQEQQEQQQEKQEQLTRRVSVKVPAQAEPVDLPSDPEPAAVFDHTNLTLIHGAINVDHILVAGNREQRGRVPSTFLLDWKSSGIGPLEVDLIQALLLVPPRIRVKPVDKKYTQDTTLSTNLNRDLYLQLLGEYCATLDIFYGIKRLDVPSLMCSMREVALLLGATRAQATEFDWNGGGDRCREILSLHKELSVMTSAAQVHILREFLKEKHATQE